MLILSQFTSVNYLWTLFFSLLLLSVSPCQSCPSHYAMATHLCILGVILFCLLFILLLQISNICWIFNIFAVFFCRFSSFLVYVACFPQCFFFFWTFWFVSLDSPAVFFIYWFTCDYSSLLGFYLLVSCLHLAPKDPAYPNTFMLFTLTSLPRENRS